VLAPSIRGQVELLLRKGREQRRNPSSFFGFSNPLKSA